MRRISGTRDPTPGREKHSCRASQSRVQRRAFDSKRGKLPSAASVTGTRNASRDSKAAANRSAKSPGASGCGSTVTVSSANAFARLTRT